MFLLFCQIDRMGETLSPWLMTVFKRLRKFFYLSFAYDIFFVLVDKFFLMVFLDFRFFQSFKEVLPVNGVFNHFLKSTMVKTKFWQWSNPKINLLISDLFDAVASLPEACLVFPYLSSGSVYCLNLFKGTMDRIL